METSDVMQKKEKNNNIGQIVNEETYIRYNLIKINPRF